MRILRNGIKTAWIPGMAAGNASQPKTRAFACPVFLDGLGGVIRAAWKKTAVPPRQWADRILVTANQCQKQFHELSPGNTHFFQQISDFPGQSPSVERQNRLARQTNNQITGRQFGASDAKGFTDQPFDQITGDRTAKMALRYDQPQPAALVLPAPKRAVM